MVDNINDFFPSNYLRAADLDGKEVDVTIDRVTSEEFEQDGKKRMKPVVHFHNAGIKPMVANKTNSLLIATALGSEKCRSALSRPCELSRQSVGSRPREAHARADRGGTERQDQLLKQTALGGATRPEP